MLFFDSIELKTLSKIKRFTFTTNVDVYMNISRRKIISAAGSISLAGFAGCSEAKPILTEPTGVILDSYMERDQFSDKDLSPIEVGIKENPQKEQVLVETAVKMKECEDLDIVVSNSKYGTVVQFLVQSAESCSQKQKTESTCVELNYTSYEKDWELYVIKPQFRGEGVFTLQNKSDIRRMIVGEYTK